MRMTVVGAATGALVMVLLAGVAGALRAQEPLDPRIAAYDKGPAKIDVSKYPPEMKARYKLFTEKCGKCHTVARAINSDFVLEDEWERYIKRMMNKAGTFISAEEGRQIFEFATYDSKTRKSALYKQKSSEASKPGGL